MQSDIKKIHDSIGDDTAVFAVLTADWHLTKRQPVSRTDDYWGALRGKVRWIVDLANALSAPIYHSGDLFDRANAGPEVERFAIEQLRRVNQGTFIVAGNHDTPYHDLGMLDQSSFGVLVAAGHHDDWFRNVDPDTFGGTQIQTDSGISILGKAWGSDLSGKLPPGDGILSILIVHHLVGGGEESAWLKEHAEEAERFLRNHLQFDLILTGHNHHQFVAEHNGRYLVNPGSITRAHKDQFDHEPAVFLLCGHSIVGGEISIERVPIPCEPAEEVLVAKDESKERRRMDLDEFIAKLKADSESSVSFVANLESYIEENEIEDDVATEIWRMVGNE